MEFLRVEFDVDGTGGAGMFIWRVHEASLVWGNPQRPAVMHEVLQHEGFISLPMCSFRICRCGRTKDLPSCSPSAAS